MWLPSDKIKLKKKNGCEAHSAAFPYENISEWVVKCIVLYKALKYKVLYSLWFHLNHVRNVDCLLKTHMMLRDSMYRVFLSHGHSAVALTGAPRKVLVKWAMTTVLCHYMQMFKSTTAQGSYFLMFYHFPKGRIYFMFSHEYLRFVTVSAGSL